MFSPTADDNAERGTNHRADTVGTEMPDIATGRSSPARRPRGQDCEPALGERVGKKRVDDGAVRHDRRRLPQVRRLEEPLQQLADGQPRTGGGEVDPAHPVGVDELPAPEPRVVGVAVHPCLSG